MDDASLLLMVIIFSSFVGWIIGTIEERKDWTTDCSKIQAHIADRVIYSCEIKK